MAATREALARTTRRSSLQPVRRGIRVAGRSALYCALLIPIALGSLALTPSRQVRESARWWGWLRTRVLGISAAPATRRPGRLRLTAHALLSLLLGAAALVPLVLGALVLVRGMFYGLVDRGPYTDSWGGPTMAGAWLAHFLVGLPLVGAASLALTGIAAVHQRLTLALLGSRQARWLVPVTLLISLAGTLFLVAWLRQLPS